MGYYAAEKLKPWLYSLYDPQNAYMYLLLGDKKALLYDTGNGTAPILPAIREITDLPIEVVLGHGHLDHANGAGQFDFVWIGGEDIELCTRHVSRTARRSVLEGIAKQGTALPADFDAEAYIQNKGANLRAMETGQIFDLGGIIARAVAMEGHTRGSMGLLIEGERTLLCSDAVNHMVWMFLAESTTIAEYTAMLRRTMALPFDTFFWAHENTEYDKKEFKKFINTAENIDINKTTPFEFTGREGLVYKDGQSGIIFSLDKM